MYLDVSKIPKRYNIGTTPRQLSATGSVLYATQVAPTDAQYLPVTDRTVVSGQVWFKTLVGFNVVVTLTVNDNSLGTLSSIDDDARAAAAAAQDAADKVSDDLVASQPMASYTAVLAAPKAEPIQEVSARVGGKLTRWVRASGGPCLGGGWAPVGTVTPEHYGATGGEAVDRSTVLQQAASGTDALDLGSGTFLTRRTSPTGGSASNPQDWAVNVTGAEWIEGNGIDSVLKAALPNNDVTMRWGVLPIGNREPDITGGGLKGVIFDGNFDASDPAVRATWTDKGSMPLWVSGVQDFTVSDVKVMNSSDYGLGLQNGRHRRLRIRDVVVDNTMNDAIDLKNNYGKGGDNSMIGVWASRFGLATDPTFPFAGIDLMAPRWVMSHIWATDWGQVGDCQSGVRFKQGETGDGGRDQGAYKAVMMGFHIEALQGGYPNTQGIHMKHRRGTVALGTIEGPNRAGVFMDQERNSALGMDIQGPSKLTGAGVWISAGIDLTHGDDAITSAIRVQNYAAGLRLDRNGSINIGHHLKGNSRAVTAAGNDNVVLAYSEDNSVAVVTDTGLRNWIGLWEAGDLNVYRGGVKRYSMGDIIENIAPLSSLVTRKSTVGGAAWQELTTPASGSGAWICNTNGAFTWQRNGVNLFRVDGNVFVFDIPTRLKVMSVNTLPSAGIAAGCMIYLTNGDAGQPCVAIYDGANWKRVALGANVSAT